VDSEKPAGQKDATYNIPSDPILIDRHCAQRTAGRANAQTSAAPLLPKSGKVTRTASQKRARCCAIPRNWPMRWRPETSPSMPPMSKPFALDRARKRQSDAMARLRGAAAGRAQGRRTIQGDGASASQCGAPVKSVARDDT
jgi:hypothetical protein